MQQIDALMHSRIANLFYARYGRRDSQEQCGGGQHTNNRTTGGTAGYGMQDTIGYDEAYKINDKITNSIVDGSIHQYAWYRGQDEYGSPTVTQVNNISCLGYEDIYGVSNAHAYSDASYTSAYVGSRLELINRRTAPGTCPQCGAEGDKPQQQRMACSASKSES